MGSRWRDLFSSPFLKVFRVGLVTVLRDKVLLRDLVSRRASQTDYSSIAESWTRISCSCRKLDGGKKTPSVESMERSVLVVGVRVRAHFLLSRHGKEKVSRRICGAGFVDLRRDSSEDRAIVLDCNHVDDV